MSQRADDLVKSLLADTDIVCSPQEFRARSAIKKLEPMYEDSAEGNLWLAVMALAIMDVSTFAPNTRNSYFAVDAYDYLSQEIIPAAEVAGIDSDYAKRVISETLQVRLG